MRVLVLDPGGSRSALAGCRALAQAGWVVGLAAAGPTFTARSRSVAARHEVPAATDSGFVGALDGVVRSGHYDVVVPAGDAELFAVSAGREGLSCRVPYAAHEVVVRALDKACLAEVARSCGVAVPEAAGVEDLPVVVKGRSHAQGRHEAVVVRSRAEYEAAVAGLAEPVVQRFVDGPLVAMSVVADAGSRVVARVQQRALAVWPSPAGVSTRAVTTAVDPSLAAAVDRLVAALGWQGLAQFQFLFDAGGSGGGGVYRLIDCNGRLYGSLSLAVAAGVNLPALWLDGAGAGAGSAVGARGRVGVRYQWLEGDVRRDPRRVLSSVAWGVRAQHSVWSPRDPLPAVAYAGTLAARVVRKAAGR